MGISWDELAEVRGQKLVDGAKIKDNRFLKGWDTYVLESEFRVLVVVSILEKSSGS